MIVTVKPGSKIDSVEKFGNEYIVRVRARAVNGKANEAVIRLIAEYFDVPKTRVRIVRGAMIRHKMLEIDKQC